MPGPSLQITFDALDPDRLAHFWAEAAGYQVQEPPEGFDSWQAFFVANNIEIEENQAAALIDPDGARPRIYIQRVPEPKSAKNRVHLDLNVVGRQAVSDTERRTLLNQEADRLVTLGATISRFLDEKNGMCVVMADPEGNEFCLQ